MSKILGCFEDDSRIPVLGFGARLWPLHYIVSHCFGLNSNIFHPLFNSVEDIQNELSDSLKKKKLVPQGPVVFSEVVKFAKEFAKFCKENDSRYYIVLLIMTTKEVSDNKAFEQELKDSLHYPISVIVCRIIPEKKTSTGYSSINTIKKDRVNAEEADNQEQTQDDSIKVYQEMSEALAK